MNSEYNSEYLRPLEFVDTPDPRHSSFARIDLNNGGFRPVELKDFHADISKFVLNETVPQAIKVQFETAKNLYLYAWFIYRFFPVSELYSFTTLEFALRTRYASEIPKSYYPRAPEPTLKPLLRYSIEQGHIRNEGFERWHEITWQRAKARHDTEAMNEMLEKGLTEMVIDDSDIEIKDIDKNWNYINILKKSLPKIRNNYAHGGSTLHHQVLGSFQIVSEIINQIYE